MEVVLEEIGEKEYVKNINETIRVDEEDLIYGGKGIRSIS